jgi:Tfp pilus assembly protein PilE
VELLAVIVILAIILVIAVPKVMSIIEDSKKATLESTAKMIASAAEKAFVQNTVLDKNKEIECSDVVKINNQDYEFRRFSQHTGCQNWHAK